MEEHRNENHEMPEEIELLGEDIEVCNGSFLEVMLYYFYDPVRLFNDLKNNIITNNLMELRYQVIYIICVIAYISLLVFNIKKLVDKDIILERTNLELIKYTANIVDISDEKCNMTELLNVTSNKEIEYINLPLNVTFIPMIMNINY